MKDFSILSWNVQGRKHRGINKTPFKKILPKLIVKPYDIICLQEMPDAAEKFAGVAAFADYHIFIPKVNAGQDYGKQGFNHNVLLSRHPILTVEEVSFPNHAKSGLAIENGIKAGISVAGQELRLYTCHFMMYKAGLASRIRQLEFILADAGKFKGPTVICGDINAVMPKNGLAKKIIKWWHRWPNEDMSLDNRPVDVDERYLVHEKIRQHGFKENFDIHKPTWSLVRHGAWELFKLKTDWLLTKNLNVVEANLGDYVSDHRPISVRCVV